ncbi:MAG: hypothetical protein V1861_02990 [Candidatus Micrarchaeota archaeon]
MAPKKLDKKHDELEMVEEKVFNNNPAQSVINAALFSSAQSAAKAERETKNRKFGNMFKKLITIER